MNIGSSTHEYIKAELNRDELAPSPFKQFEIWYKQAYDSADIVHPNAMSLATVSSQGTPTLRTVLLKMFDEDGFIFFTNYESRKSRHIQDNPNVSILFLWKTLERQVTITGTASKISTAESLKYFSTRPRGSQLGAWISDQSSVISSRKILEQKLQEIKNRFSSRKISLPSFWGGYRVVPKTIEFWQGRPSRLNDRFEYSINDDLSWTIERLAP